jgi:hypothetical protein
MNRNNTATYQQSAAAARFKLAHSIVGSRPSTSFLSPYRGGSSIELEDATLLCTGGSWRASLATPSRSFNFRVRKTCKGLEGMMVFR